MPIPTILSKQPVALVITLLPVSYIVPADNIPAVLKLLTKVVLVAADDKLDPIVNELLWLTILEIPPKTPLLLPVVSIQLPHPPAMI